MSLFDHAHQVCTLLIQAGHPTMFAGGCVRDRLLGVEPKDYDLATTAPPETTMQILIAHDYPVIPIGLQHGTVGAVTQAGLVEVTTLRQDLACDGRHATVGFTDDFKADAQRRDLTINGLFQDVDGQIHDYVDGLTDIRCRRLRFIGLAHDRIREDYLRILRYFRFCARLGWQADASATAAIAANRAGLKQIAMERIVSEMDQIFTLPFSVQALDMAIATGCLAELFPTFQNPDLCRYAHCLRQFEEPTSDLGWFLFLWLGFDFKLGKPFDTFCERLRFSRRRKRMMVGLLDFLNQSKNFYAAMERFLSLLENQFLTSKECLALLECSQHQWPPGWLEVFQKTAYSFSNSPLEMDRETLLTLPKTTRSDAVKVAKIFWYLGWCDGKTQLKKVLLGANNYRIWLEKGHLHRPPTI